MNKYKFKDIAFNINDKRMPEPDDKYNYIGLEHLDSGSLKVNRWGSDVDIIGQKLVMHKGDILFGRRNTYLKRVAIAPHDGLFSAHGMIFHPNEDVIDKEFFPFFISSDYFMNAAIKISVGSLSPTVNWGTLKELEFELPSLPEQKKIANLLLAMNDTKEKYINLLNKTDELVKSRFVELFDKNENTKLTISEVCEVFTDGDWIESKDQSDSGIWLIQTGNIGNGVFKSKEDKKHYISEETFNKLNCTEIYEGDILISRLPDPVGRSCIIPKMEERCITAVDCTIIRLKEIVNPKYFVAFTNTQEYFNQLQVTGSTRKRVSRKNLGNVLIPVPPIELQTEFAEFVEKADKSKFNLQQSIKNVEDMMKSILNDTFSIKEVEK